MRRLAAQYSFATRHREWVLAAVLVAWLVHLAHGLASIYLSRHGDIVPVPGSDTLSAWLTSICSVVSAGGLGWLTNIVNNLQPMKGITTGWIDPRWIHLMFQTKRGQWLTFSEARGAYCL